MKYILYIKIGTPSIDHFNYAKLLILQAVKLDSCGMGLVKYIFIDLFTENQLIPLANRNLKILWDPHRWQAAQYSFMWLERIKVKVLNFLETIYHLLEYLHSTTKRICILGIYNYFLQTDYNTLELRLNTKAIKYW